MKKLAIVLLSIELLSSLVPLFFLSYITAYSNKSFFAMLFYPGVNYEDGLIAWALFFLISLPIAAIIFTNKSRYTASITCSTAATGITIAIILSVILGK